MKFTNNPKQLMNGIVWRLAVVVLAAFIVAIAPPDVALTALVIIGVVALFLKRLVLTKIPWQEKRRIATQPNAHQREYILQRLRQLSYNNDTYSTRDPLEEKTFTVSHYLNERLTVVYVIEFVEKEYVRAVDIGNEYQHTKRSYSLSPKWSTIPYEEVVTYHYSGVAWHHKREIKRAVLGYLPDDVIEYIEHALINWEPVSAR